MEGLMLATYVVKERMQQRVRGSHPVEIGGLPFARTGLWSLGGTIGAIGLVSSALTFFGR
jgi:hypothetical protein